MWHIIIVCKSNLDLVSFLFFPALYIFHFEIGDFSVYLYIWTVLSIFYTAEHLCGHVHIIWELSALIHEVVTQYITSNRK